MPGPTRVKAKHDAIDATPHRRPPALTFLYQKDRPRATVPRLVLATGALIGVTAASPAPA